METSEIFKLKTLKFEDFDFENFDWTYSYLLPELYSDKFDLWWDKDKYNWEFSDYLIKYVPQHFDTWWDAEKFNWKFAKYLPLYLPGKFNEWFVPKYLTMYDLSYIVNYCSEQLNRWFKTNDCDDWMEELYYDVQHLYLVYKDYNLDSCAYQQYKKYLLYIARKLRKKNKGFSINLFIKRYFQIRGLFYAACQRIDEMEENRCDADTEGD